MFEIYKAKKELKISGCSAVYINKRKKTHEKSYEKGIKPILTWLKNPKKPLEEAVFADKIIGKAAAMLLVKARVKKVYGETLSKSAAAVFNKYGIRYSYGKMADYIVNRTNTGLCPMEKTVLNIENIEDAFIALQQKSEELNGK